MEYTSDDVPFGINPEQEAFANPSKYLTPAFTITPPDNTPRANNFVEVDLSEVNDRLRVPSNPFGERVEGIPVSKNRFQPLSSPK